MRVALKHSSAAEIDAVLAQLWADTEFHTPDTLRQFRALLHAQERTLRGEQKLFAVLTEFMLLRELHQIKAAQELREQFHKQWTRLKDPLLRHRWQRMQASEAFGRGEYTATLPLSDTLVAEADEFGTLSDSLHARFLRYHLLMALGLFAPALQTMQEANRLAIKEKDDFAILYTHHMLLSAYETSGRPQEALREAENVAHLFRPDLSHPVHRFYHNLVASCQVQCGQYAAAAKGFERILAYLRTMPEPPALMLMSALSNIAVAYLMLKQFSKSELAINEVIKLCDPRADARLIITQHINRSELYEQWRKPQLMLRAIHDGEALVREHHVLRYEVKLLDARARYYDLIKQPAKALKALQHYQKRFAEWKAIDDAEKLRALELKHELQLEYQKNETMQKEVQTQQQLLEQQSSFLKQKDKLISEFASHFDELEQTNLRRKEIFERLKEMVRTVQQTEQEDRGSYSTQFNNAHAESIGRLMKKYPKLTNGEAKIGVMLTRGLSNKDIASLTLTTVRNVEFHRLQLRKKMKLKRADDLIKVLSAILQ